MALCEYWWQQDDGTEWCDLINNNCTCLGSDQKCLIKSRNVSELMRHSGNMSDEDTRVPRRKRGLQESL